MTDLGFGLADRRSVFAVLFTLAAASLLFGNPLPVDGSGAAAFFVSVLALIGFLIGARMLSRLALAAVYFLLRLPFDLASADRLPDPDAGEPSPGRDRRPARRSAAGSAQRRPPAGPRLPHALRWSMFVPLLIEQDWEWRYGGYLFALGVLGVCDRLALIVIAFAATVPALAAAARPDRAGRHRRPARCLRRHWPLHRLPEGCRPQGRDGPPRLGRRGPTGEASRESLAQPPYLAVDARDHRRLASWLGPDGRTQQPLWPSAAVRLWPPAVVRPLKESPTMIYALKYGSVSGKVRQEIRLAIARQGDLAPYVAQGLIAHIVGSHPGGDYHCLYCGDQLKPYALARPGKRVPAENWYFQHMGNGKCIGPATTPTSDFKNPAGHGCFVSLGCETDDAGNPTAHRPHLLPYHRERPDLLPPGPAQRLHPRRGHETSTGGGAVASRGLTEAARARHGTGARGSMRCEAALEATSASAEEQWRRGLDERRRRRRRKRPGRGARGTSPRRPRMPWEKPRPWTTRLYRPRRPADAPRTVAA